MFSEARRKTILEQSNGSSAQHPPISQGLPKVLGGGFTVQKFSNKDT